MKRGLSIRVENMTPLEGLRAIPNLRVRAPTGYIQRTPDDIDFRKKFIEFISSTKQRMRMISGECGVFGFDDVKQAFEDARVNDVTIEVYNVRAPSNILEELEMLGCDVCTGEFVFPDEHYASFDDSTYMISEQAGRGDKLGEGLRHGPYWQNDPDGVTKIGEYFQMLFGPSEVRPPRVMPALDVEVKDARQEVWSSMFGEGKAPPLPEKGASKTYSGFLDRIIRSGAETEEIYKEIRGKS